MRLPRRTPAMFTLEHMCRRHGADQAALFYARGYTANSHVDLGFAGVEMLTFSVVATPGALVLAESSKRHPDHQSRQHHQAVALEKKLIDRAQQVDLAERLTFHFGDAFDPNSTTAPPGLSYPLTPGDAASHRAARLAAASVLADNEAHSNVCLALATGGFLGSVADMLSLGRNAMGYDEPLHTVTTTAPSTL